MALSLQTVSDREEVENPAPEEPLYFGHTKSEHLMEEVSSYQTDQGEWSFHNQVRLFHTYVARKQMRVGDLITSRHSPAEAAAVYAGLLEDRSATIGVVFDWSEVE